jgi:hypothetical protein
MSKGFNRKDEQRLAIALQVIKSSSALKSMNAMKRQMWAQGFMNGMDYQETIASKDSKIIKFLKRFF